MPSAAVIIVTWNALEDTVACLQSVLKTLLPGQQVIVCDNASSDGSWQHLLEWANQSRQPHRIYDSHNAESRRDADDPALVFVQTGANLGYAGGNNVGLRYALKQGHRYFWILTSDTIVNERSLSALIRRVQLDERIGICGSTLVYSHDPSKIQALGGATFNFATGVGTHIGLGESFNADKLSGIAKRQKSVEECMDYVVGASMLVTRKFIESVGLMDESYFLYFEEIDWAIRGKVNFRLGWAPDSVVLHKEGGSIGSSHTERPSRTALTYMTRNRLKFAARYSPEHYWSVWRRLCFEVLVYAKRRDLEAVKLLVDAVIGGIRLKHAPVG